jgi:drug/metabolite transporter (DMT)-like permease
VGIVLGVSAALFWGLGDYFITQLTRRVGTSIALLCIQVLSLAAWVGFLLAAPPGNPLTPGLWAVVGATAVCHVLGLVFVYRAFEVGTLSLVSPISAGFAVVTALLALAAGERPPAAALVGAALVIAGATVATRPATPGSARATLAGVPEAVASALAFGTMFWLFYFFVQPRLGYAMPLVTLKAMAVGGSLLALMRAGAPGAESRPPRRRGVVLLAVGAASADTIAWLAYIGGTSAAYATVVTALASLFSVVTVLLAWAFLRERLAAHQWVGVAVILGGILLVSV